MEAQEIKVILNVNADAIINSKGVYKYTDYISIVYRIGHEYTNYSPFTRRLNYASFYLLSLEKNFLLILI